eukprot:Pgem_evm1s12462
MDLQVFSSPNSAKTRKLEFLLSEFKLHSKSRFSNRAKLGETSLSPPFPPIAGPHFRLLKKIRHISIYSK